MIAETPTSSRPLLARARVFRAEGIRPADLVGFVVVVGFIIYGFGGMDLPVDGLPPIGGTTIRIIGPLLFLMSLGALCIAEGERVKRLPVSFPIVLFLGFQVMSMAWTTNPGQWREGLVRSVLPGIGVIICAGLTDLRVFIKGILTGIRAMLVITCAALVLFPGSTTFGMDDARNIQPGWHGLFLHKNVLSMFLVFSLVTVLCLDRSKLLKLASLITITVLLIGSSSTTGFAGALVVLLMLVWLVVYRATAVHSTFIFVLVTLAGFLALIPITYGILPTVVGWFGKDLTFSGRTAIWRASLNALRGHELAGYGLGGLWFDAGSVPTQNLRLDIGFSVVHAHNGAIELLIQLGVVGLVLFGAVWTATIVSGGRLMRTSGVRLGMWTLSWAMAVLMMGFSENVFLGGWVTVLAVMRVIGLREEIARARAAETDEQPADEMSRPSRTPTRPRQPVGV
ncbi:MAG: O-antigen ligase family protein [Acidimicrobiia bacterium]